MENDLKRWFVSGAGVAGMAMAGYSLYALFLGGSLLAWAGSLVSHATFMLIMAVIMAPPIGRTSERLPWALGSVTVGVGLAVLGVALDGGSWLALGSATLGAVTIVLYVFWYSRLGREPSDALEVGAPLPEMRFEDESGRPVSTADLEGPLILMFYRGNWCPLCNTQIREMASRYREIDARGATVAFVSSQSHEETRKIASRFDIPARFLVDVEGAVAQQLGIVHEGGLPGGLEVMGFHSDTVFPTVVIADRDHTIVFADQTDNYRVRPEPDVFLRVLDGLPPSSVDLAAAE